MFSFDSSIFTGKRGGEKYLCTRRAGKRGFTFLGETRRRQRDKFWTASSSMHGKLFFFCTAAERRDSVYLLGGGNLTLCEITFPGRDTNSHFPQRKLFLLNFPPSFLFYFLSCSFSEEDEKRHLI